MVLESRSSTSLEPKAATSGGQRLSEALGEVRLALESALFSGPGPPPSSTQMESPGPLESHQGGLSNSLI